MYKNEAEYSHSTFRENNGEKGSITTCFSQTQFSYEKNHVYNNKHEQLPLYNTMN